MEGAAAAAPAAAPSSSTLALANELANAFETLPDVDAPATIPFESHFHALYEHLPETSGKAASRREREENGYQSSTLVYGEISYEPFAREFLKIKYMFGGLGAPGGVFVDIGCGSGKPVFAAALLHDFDVCKGIEILSGLCGMCNQLRHHVWDAKVKLSLPPAKQATEVLFENGDATVLDWSDGDVVFANSTCFDAPLMAKLASRASLLKAGAFFITTTQRLPSDEFELLSLSRMPGTWGEATLFLQRKLPDPL